jgi:multidrug resistance protein, MATE family
VISIRLEMKKFLQLAIPLASAQLAQSLTGFVDTLMMGRLGTTTLAAGGIASLSFFAFLLTLGGLVMAVTPAIATAYGAADEKRIGSITRQGLWLALLLTVPMTVGLTRLDSLMLKLGQAEATVTIANIYLDLMAWACFPALGFIVLRGVVSALSQARPIMFIVFMGAIFDIVGNYVLAFGKWGFPRLGIAGLAISSVVTYWGMFFALVIYILQNSQLRKYGILQQLEWIKIEPIRELLRVGFPIAIYSALEIGLFTIVTYLMGILGTDVLAAHQIVFETVTLIFMIPWGMSLAATVRVGQWLGQKNFYGVKQSGYLSIAVGFIFMTLMAIALLLFPRSIIGIYIDIRDPANASVIALVLPMLAIAAVSQILDGVHKISYGALQGLQDTRVPMMLSILAFWLVGLPLGYWLGFQVNWGGVGLWLGQSLGIAIAGIVFTWRFYYLTSQK